MKSTCSKYVNRASALKCPRHVTRRDRKIQAIKHLRCDAFVDGQGSECISEWDTSEGSVGRDVVEHSDMQAGFSGRIDELHDLHMDVVDNRYLVGGSFAAAAIPDSIPLGIECQNVAPWRHVHRSVNLLKAKSIWGEINEVYVFLFGGEAPGCTGIYSLRTFSLENIPRETVIAFECLDDAVRYGGLLASTMNLDPTVHGITPEQLAEFCMDSGYSCQLEAAGSSLAPPGFNVRVTDWERASRLRSGEFCVLSNEPYQGAYEGSAHDAMYDMGTLDMDLGGLDMDMGASTSLSVLPGVMESVTPFLEEQVAYYYNNFNELCNTQPSSDAWAHETNPELRLEAMRQHLERMW